MCKAPATTSSTRAAYLAPPEIPDALISMPRVECTIHVDGSGNLCGGGKGFLDASALVWDAPSRSCAKLELGTMDPPPWFGSSATIGGYTISRSSFVSAGCTAQLDISGALPNGAQLAGMIEVVTNAGGHRVVPWLLVASVADCTSVAGIECTGVLGGTGDTVYACP